MIEDVLSRLQGVRRTGPGRWVARCPAHEDKSPSLNIKEENGTALVICRAHCDQDSIREALGLPWSAFFEAKNFPEHRKSERSFPASDVLMALDDEAMFVAVCALNLANGVELTAADRERLMIAYKRIAAAREMALGPRETRIGKR